MAQVGVVAVGTWLVIPSMSLNAGISVLRSRDPNYSPSANAVETPPDAARRSSKIALADKEATDQILKLITNRATLVKHAEWRKTHRGRWLIPLIGIRR